MLNSAKGFVTRRAPAKTWFHDGKSYDEKTEEEKKKNPPNFQTSTTLSGAGQALKGLLYGWTNFTDKIEDRYNEIKDAVGDTLTTPQSGVVAKPIIYSDWSPASKLFGMDQGTAFSEHMANTSHQREVADLKAAGLNPVLGISGSGAAAVSGNAAVGSSSAEKAESVPWLDVLGATAAVVATASGKPELGSAIGNLLKSLE